MPEVNNNQDWFKGRITGTIKGNLADVADTYGDTKFTMNSKDSYLKDPELMKVYKQNYGNQAEAKFTEDYNAHKKEYQGYRANNFDKLSFSTPKFNPGMSAIFGSKLPERNTFYDAKKVNASNDGAYMEYGQVTQATKDARKAHDMANVYLNDQGKEIKMATKDQAYASWDKYVNKPADFLDFGQALDNLVDMVASIPAAMSDGKESGMYYMIGNPKYANAQGKKIIGFVYKDGSTDPGNNVKPGYQAVYEGQYRKNAGKQVVSIYDEYKSNYKLDAGALDFTGRTLNNTAIGILDIFQTVRNASKSAIWGNDAVEQAGAGMMMNKMGQIKQAKHDEGAGFLGSWDSIAGLAADVVMQIGTGAVMGKSGLMLSRALLKNSRYATLIGATTTAAKTAHMAKVAKAAGLMGMSLYGAKDMYHTAIENGFSGREAAGMFGAMFGAMMVVNNRMDALDGMFDANRLVKASRNIIDDNLVYVNKKVLNDALSAVPGSTDELLKNSAKKEMLNNFYNDVKVRATKFMTQDRTGGTVKQYLKAANWEGVEEVAEALGEEGVKAGQYAIKALTGYESEDDAKGNMYDPHYWDNFMSNLGQNYVGGMMGGTAAKMMGLTAKDHKLTSDMTSIYASGNADQFESYLDLQHSKGLLGDTELTIDYDHSAGAYKTKTENPEGISMNDANKQVILQKWNYIKSMVDSIGGPEIINHPKFLKDSEELKTILSQTDITKDAKELVNRYVKLAIETDLAPDNKIDSFKEDATEEEKQEAIEKDAKVNNVDPETVKEIKDIKTQLENIRTGKTAGKYFLDFLSKGTVLDIDAPENVLYSEIYGKHILSKLMEASDKSAVEIEKLKSDIAEVIKENDKAIESIKDDLSNVDVILPLLNQPKLHLSDKSKEKVTTLLETLKVDPGKMKAAKEALMTSIAPLYNEEAIKETSEYKKLLEEDAANGTKEGQLPLAEKYLAFAEAYYQAKISAQVKELKTFKDIHNFEYQGINNLLYTIDDFVSTSGDQTLETITKGSPSKYLIKDIKTLEEAKTLGEKIAIAVTKADLTYSNVKQNNLTDIAENSNFLSSILQDLGFKLLSDFAIKAKGVNGDEDAVFDPNDLSFLRKGFKSVDNQEAVEDTVDLFTLLSNLSQEAENSKVGDHYTFSNTDEVNDLLRQINARLVQLQTIGASYEEGDGNKNLGDLISQFEYRKNKIANKENTTTSEIFSGLLGDKLNPIFNTASINPVRASILQRKVNEGVATPEEVEELSGHTTRLSNLSTISQQLLAARAAAENLRDLALNNQEQSSAVKVHRDSIINSIKEDKYILHNILIMGDFEKETNPEIKAMVSSFMEWYMNPLNNTDDGIADSFQHINKIKRFLYEQNLIDNQNMLSILDKVYKADREDVADRPTITAEKAEYNYAKGLLAINLNHDDFYAEYAKILESTGQKGITTADQDTAVMMLVAHILSPMSSQYTLQFNRPNDFSDVMALFGLQGAGKTSYVLSTALSIAQTLQNKKYPSNKNQVLLASNLTNQVKVLHDSISGIGVDIYPTLFTSKETSEEKWTPIDLIRALESGDPKLQDITTIVFDEATYLEYNYINDRRGGDAKTRSQLGKIVHLVQEINKKRGSKKPHLKLILTGDRNQNGYTDAEGMSSNIGSPEVWSSVLKTPELTYNHRSRITAVNSFVEQQVLKRSVAEGAKKTSFVMDSLDNLQSTWGLITERLDKLMGGVKFENDRSTVFNDEALIKNIEDLIILRNSSANEEPFLVGVILPAGEKELPASLLKDLQNKYPDNFRIDSHVSVQGSEFDYVIGVMSVKDLGNSKDEWPNNQAQRERNSAKRLATTIGRARYFSVIINETQRNFSSTQVDNIYLIKPEMDTEIINSIFKLKMKMLDYTPEPISEEAIQESKEKSEADKLAEAEENQKAQELKALEDAKIAKRMEQLNKIAAHQDDIELTFKGEDKTIYEVWEVLYTDNNVSTIFVRKSADAPEIQLDVDNQGQLIFNSLDVVPYTLLPQTTMRPTILPTKTEEIVTEVEQPSIEVEYNSQIFSLDPNGEITIFVDGEETTPNLSEEDVDKITKLAELEINPTPNFTNNELDWNKMTNVFDQTREELEEELENIKQAETIDEATPEEVEEVKLKLNEKIESEEEAVGILDEVTPQVFDTFMTILDKQNDQDLESALETKQRAINELLDIKDSLTEAEFNDRKNIIEANYLETKKSISLAKRKVDAIQANKELSERGISYFYPFYRGSKGYTDTERMEDFNSRVEALYGLQEKMPAKVYRSHQEAALGLVPNGMDNYTYSVVAYKTQKAGGTRFFTEMIVIATEKSTGIKIVIGNLVPTNYIANSDINGMSFLKSIENLLPGFNDIVIADANKSNIELPVGSTIRQAYEAKLTSPYLQLNLEHMGVGTPTPANVSNSREGLKLSKEKLALIKASSKGDVKFSPIFLWTKAESSPGVENPHRGDGFILYTRNPKITFNENQMLKNGVPVNSKPEIFGEELAGNIGIIHLDARPLSLEEIKNDLDSNPIDVELNINNPKTQRKLAKLFAQLKVELGQNLTNNSTLTGFAYNDNIVREFDAESLNWIKSFIEDKLNLSGNNIDNIAANDLLNLLAHENFNSFGQVSGKVRATSNNLAFYPLFKKIKSSLNIMDIALGEDIDPNDLGDKASADNARFNLMSLFRTIKDITKSEDVTESKNRETALLQLLTDVLEKSKSFKNGIYARLTIEKDSDNNNRTFGGIPTNSEKYYNINVSSIDEPTIRFAYKDILGVFEESLNKPAVENIPTTTILSSTDKLKEIAEVVKNNEDITIDEVNILLDTLLEEAPELAIKAKGIRESVIKRLNRQKKSIAKTSKDSKTKLIKEKISDIKTELEIPLTNEEAQIISTGSEITLEEELSPEAAEIINIPLNLANDLLSLPLDSAEAIEEFSESLETVKSDLRAKTEELTNNLVDKSMDITPQVEEVITALDNKLSDASSYLFKEGDKITNENLDYFIASIAVEDIETIKSATTAERNDLIQFLNGETTPQENDRFLTSALYDSFTDNTIEALSNYGCF